MMQEVAGTDKPLKEIVENYQAQCQADWEENLWYVPDVVAV
jgi:ribosomal protein S17E